MRFVPLLLVAALVASCSSTGTMDPNLADRVAADLQCLTALAKAGIQVQGQATKNPTAVQVMSTIQTVGESKVPPDVLSACAQTLQNGAADAQGIAARVKARQQAK